MKSSFRKTLQRSILAVLAAGTLGAGTAGAAVIDMTSGEYAGGYTVTDPAEAVTADLVYHWDKATQKIVGGNFVVSSNKNNEYINAHLRISAGDLQTMSAEDVKKAMTQLAGKAANQLTSSIYTVKAYVQVVDDVNSASPKVLRSYTVNFGDENKTGLLGDLESAYYTTVVRPEGEGSGEFDYNSDGNIKLSYSNTAGFHFAPDFTEAADDQIYAAVRSGKTHVGIVNYSGGSTDMAEAVFTADASAHAGARAYGVYSDSEGTVEIALKHVTFNVTGDHAAGVYAGNQSDDVKSIVYLDAGSLTFNQTGKTTVGLEAGKNGQIVLPEKIHNAEKGVVTVTISSPDGYALYAHDGGQIKLNNINVTASGKDSIYAEKGGVIEVGNLSGAIGTISTDDDPDSKISGSLSGNYDGDIKGNVALKIAGTWNGDNYSTGDLAVSGGTWNGNMGMDGSSIGLENNGTWNLSAGKGDVHLSKMLGSRNVINRGFVNMAEGTNLTIDKFAGEMSFNYQHDKDDPAKLLGGQVTVKAAAPITISSEGIGFGDEAGTTAGTLPSTIKMVTPYDASITDANAEAVLNALARKLTYTNYASGERGMTATAVISEGLTGSSKTKYFTDIAFDKTTGQGGSSAVYQPITSVLTGSVKDGQDYDAYGTKDEKGENYTRYDFDKDVYIQKIQDTDDRVQKPKVSMGLYAGLVTNFGSEWNWPSNWGMAKSDDGPSYTIDMHGHDLTIEYGGFPAEGKTGSQPMWTTVALWATREGTITIDNAGKLSVTSNANYYYGSAIRASTNQRTQTGAHIVINNDKEGDQAVVLRGGIATPGYELNYRTIESYTNGDKPYNQQNTVTVKGLVDIESKNGASIFARGGVISLGGGRIIAKNYDSIWTIGKTGTDDGRVDINVKVDENGKIIGTGSNDVVIEGSAATATPYYGNGGTINIAMTTAASSFTGNFYGTGDNNLWLQNGAVWNNGPTDHHNWSSGTIASSGTDSIVTALRGGADAQHAGIIRQNGVNDITIGTLSGYINIYMDKVQADLPDGSKDNSSAFSGRGNVIIKSAEQTNGQNAVVTVRTDSDGVDLGNETAVKKVLNQLANRIVYDGYVDGERNLTGYAQIAEGLTASSYQKQMGIIFDEYTGAGRVQKEPLGQTKTLFTGGITGDVKADKEYRLGGVVAEGGYTFNEASVIQPPKGSKASKGIISIQSKQASGETPAERKNVTINAHNGLTLDSTQMNDKMDASGLYASNGSTVAFNGDLDIEMVNILSNGTRYGIYQQQESDYSPAADPTNTVINGNLRIKITNAITDGFHMPEQYYPRVDKVAGIYNSESQGSAITVNGMVDIDVEGTAIMADNPTDGKSVITVKGGKIIARNVEATPRQSSGTEKVLLNNHALAAYGGTINVGMNTAGSETRQMRAAGTDAARPNGAVVQMEGNIITMKDALTSAANKNLTDGTINLGLAAETSYWKGIADNAGAGKLGTFNLYLQNGARWFNEKQGASYQHGTSDEAIGGSWDGVSHVTNFTGGADERSRGVIAQKDAALEIGHYSGHAVAIYGHNTQDPASIEGGTVTIHTADAGSVMTMLTDSNGIDMGNKEQMTHVLTALAKKLIYTDAAEGKTDLSARAVIGEGITSSWAEYWRGNVSFDQATGTGIFDAGSLSENTGNTNPIYTGQYETLIMSGAKSAMVSSALLWRSGLRDMEQRLGDLHNDQGESGVWANVYGGESKMDQQNTHYETSYRAYQAGYDKVIGHGWRAGVGISYTDGDGKYSLGGEGDLKNTLFTLYGTKTAQDGSYVDIVAKGGKVKNDYTVYNDMGHRVDADYDTTGYGLSVEYGKRIEGTNGFYVQPEAQLSYGRLSGTDYTGTSDMVDGNGAARVMNIRQDDFDSLVGRIGVSAGKVLAGGSSFYAKASLLHEFEGNFESAFTSEEEKSTKVDLGGSWMNLQVGGTIRLANGSYFYGSYSRNFGNNDAADDWNVSLGMRYAF